MAYILTYERIRRDVKEQQQVERPRFFYMPVIH
jgi:hypothetical protein